ncbi:MAG: hypothetical protein FIA99_06765 [Ruminiclostridium sp.]|nr:hypothetical protein [Ruminiclostridium sp.]
MSESFQHQQLIQLLRKEVVELIPIGCQGLIQQDSSDSLALPPKTIDGYRPDIYYCFEDLLIIGEAKAAEDVERRHSRAQYEAYLRECASFNGRAILLMAVPWMECATAHNILQNLRKNIPGNYSTKILEWIGGVV